MKTYRLFFVSVYRFIWNTFLYDISSILLIIIFKLIFPFRFVTPKRELKAEFFPFCWLASNYEGKSKSRKKSLLPLQWVETL